MPTKEVRKKKLLVWREINQHSGVGVELLGQKKNQVLKSGKEKGISIIIIVFGVSFNLIYAYKKIYSQGKTRKENKFYKNLETH